MKRFRYRLEALRTLRRLEEHRALEDYARALMSKRELDEAISSRTRDVERASEYLQDRLKGTLTGQRIRELELHCHALREDLAETRKSLKEQEKEISQFLDRMLAAKRKREVLDKHADQRKRRYLEDVNREERKFVDELGNRGSNRVGLFSALTRVAEFKDSHGQD